MKVSAVCGRCHTPLQVPVEHFNDRTRVYCDDLGRSCPISDRIDRLIRAMGGRG